ncbi:MAG TPA: hypothetical protein VJB94_04260 [Candidatus Nanoarchaeia archaeon]|nr:hypothetical protein [Candidatus Nanoarchaeia archaeon]
MSVTFNIESIIGFLLCIHHSTMVAHVYIILILIISKEVDG